MSDFIRKQTKTAEADRPWTVAVLWTLRIILTLTILAEAAAGDLLYAAEALLALALCSLAGSLLKVEGGPSPLDVEIVLLLMAVGNCTLGVAGNLYRSLPYYDKFLHVANPLALAFYCLPLLASSLNSGRRNMAVALAALTVLAITGASAVWEILEYASDELFMSNSQGSPTMMPLDDTMWDLILSFLGALLGAIAAAISAHGSIYIASFAGDRSATARLYAAKGVQINGRQGFMEGSRRDKDA